MKHQCAASSVNRKLAAWILLGAPSLQGRHRDVHLGCQVGDGQPGLDPQPANVPFVGRCRYEQRCDRNPERGGETAKLPGVRIGPDGPHWLTASGPDTSTRLPNPLCVSPAACLADRKGVGFRKCAMSQEI